MGQFKLRNRKWYPWAFLGTIIAAAIILYYVSAGAPNAEATFLAIGTVGGFVGFLYSQHLQQTNLFKELFTDFNKRYDKLNSDLNKILTRSEGAPLSDCQKNKLYDYFNLCAEEFLFFKAGYIDADVWKAWCAGMQVFRADPEIAALWTHELNTGSYYGFVLGEVSHTAE